jgi:hypothetical protein
MVEKEVGSSEKLEYFFVNEWVSLTNMSDLANYKRLAKFDYMSVVPLRVPSQYVGDDDIDGVRYSRR